MSTELIMLGMSALIAIGILLHQPSKTLGLPSLLIFIGVGLLFGNGEFNFVYDDLALTSFIGSLALNVIVFVGGLNTSKSSIKVAYKEGGVLSSVGVLFTTVIFGGLLYFITDFNIITCLLFAAVVSSTDAAAVFSILESKKLKLKESTDTILEFESATNDPVALLLVAILTEMLVNTDQQISGLSIGIELVQQIIVGLGAGYLIGWCCVWLLNKIKLEEYGLIPVFILASFFIAAYGSDLLGGNILVSSYVAGVFIGNELKRGREVSKHFFHSLSWLAQALMFIILGLQFFPKELFADMWAAIIPAFALIFIARPLAVFLSYLPFRRVSFKKRLFISAIGLKGATPIVFALIPASAGVPGSQEMIHMVFFIVLISVVLQGWAIDPLSNKLGLVDK
ncbi:potassium/proton antiporter [Photobacterium lutimaris]|uniref:Potassium/proton antiporter n=1 Tax=Photobacterium lutimaris TaxID=388278 RepID=A0A2T3IZ68_9GAMM|nr:potassium/proton antiporter [Photobacterium lutimaris]PSU33965.1 potassium/proton antiporter [Photobacterium lutimaris]TDR76301.1 potassium/proton antiporter (CPA1 family) [Photobacterium lutimaris]